MNRFYTLMILAISMPWFAFANEVERGEKVFKKCRSCHQVGAKAKIKNGPPLNGLIGRIAGTYEGAKYSDAMQSAGAGGLTWTEANLDQFLTKPRSFVAHTSMSFSGLKKSKDRAAVIAYLMTFNVDAGMLAAKDDPAINAEILAMVGDVEYGEYLGSSCVTCHQVDGTDQGLPSITGWPSAAFVTVMHAYKNKHRDNPVMQQHAGALSNEEIAALAAYFESVQ